MQKDRWEQEYRELNNLPSSKTSHPSRALSWFIEEYEPTPGKALDVGAGKGRNSSYLAKNGFEVTALEIVDFALEAGKEMATKEGLLDKIKFMEGSSGEKLPFEDDSFDLVIDMMVMHLLNESERSVYGKEVVRVLKPGGSFLFYTIAADSPAAQELFRESPGPEPNSYVIPQTGMIEKAFTTSDLIKMFYPLSVESIVQKTEFTPAFGDVYERVYLRGIMKKES